MSEIFPPGSLNNDAEVFPPTTPTSASGAPTDAQYVVMTLSGSLSAERRLQVTGAGTLTDGGANGDATINVQTAAQEGSGFNWGKYIEGRLNFPFG